MNEWDQFGPGMKIDRRATDCGLASLGISGIFLLMAPIQLIFNDFYYSIGIHHAFQQEIDLARIAVPVVGLIYLVLMGFGIFCGVRGLGIARTTQQAAALPLAGIVVGTADVLLWIALGINLMAILSTVP